VKKKKKKKKKKERREGVDINSKKEKEKKDKKVRRLKNCCELVLFNNKQKRLLKEIQDLCEGLTPR
jgi:hypothetical protein